MSRMSSSATVGLSFCLPWRKKTTGALIALRSCQVLDQCPPERKSRMTLAYVVRCNFSDPEKEQAWNDWYSGPKLKQMLDKPYFLTVQRYRRVSGTGRNYLAFWT